MEIKSIEKLLIANYKKEEVGLMVELRLYTTCAWVRFLHFLFLLITKVPAGIPAGTLVIFYIINYL